MKIERLKYTPDANYLFSAAVFTPAENQEIMAQVKDGRAQLWRCGDFLHAVTRVEDVRGEKTFVFVGAERIAGKRDGNAFDLFGWFVDLGIKEGFDRVRLHTNQDNVASIAQGHGFKVLETVYIKDLK